MSAQAQQGEEGEICSQFAYSARLPHQPIAQRPAQSIETQENTRKPSKRIINYQHLFCLNLQNGDPTR